MAAHSVSAAQEIVPNRIGKEVNIFASMASENETGLVNFVCTVFEQSDKMLTLLSMEKPMGECNNSLKFIRRHGNLQPRQFKGIECKPNDKSFQFQYQRLEIVHILEEIHTEATVFQYITGLGIHPTLLMKMILVVVVVVVVCSGLTSLSTFFQSYHDGVWLRQGAKCSLL